MRVGSLPTIGIKTIRTLFLSLEWTSSRVGTIVNKKTQNLLKVFLNILRLNQTVFFFQLRDVARLVIVPYLNFARFNNIKKSKYKNLKHPFHVASNCKKFGKLSSTKLKNFWQNISFLQNGENSSRENHWNHAWSQSSNQTYSGPNAETSEQREFTPKSSPNWAWLMFRG
jgi:hypothetical protein